MSGAYDDARAVTRALADRAASTAIGHDASRQVLDRLGESTAMRETVLLLGDVDVETLETLSDIVTMIGPSSIEALKAVLASEQETVAFQRAAELTVRFERVAVSRLTSLIDDERWFVQRHGAQLLGRIAAPDGVPLLQALLRKGDLRVTRAAVSALAGIPGPSAARAIHTILRAATGAVRAAVIEALVADRDARVVPMLARIVAESRALGQDHEVVLETLTALGTVGSDDAIPSLVAAIKVRSFWRRKKARAIKERGVNALGRIGSAKAQDALAGAAKTGDRSLRKIVRAKVRP